MATKQRTRRNKSIVALIVAALGLGSGGAWLARSGHDSSATSTPVQGTLRVNINTSTLTEPIDTSVIKINSTNGSVCSI